MRLRVPALLVLALALALAGCTGPQDAATTPTPTATPTATPAPTPLPPGDVDFPDGPKERPERPDQLTASSVGEYVEAFEYRYAYNSLWLSEYSTVTLACRLDNVTERSWGYAAVVTCTGYSNTTPPANATETAGPHADWFTQSFRYRVSEHAIHREQIENRDPVS